MADDDERRGEERERGWFSNARTGKGRERGKEVSERVRAESAPAANAHTGLTHSPLLLLMDGNRLLSSPPPGRLSISLSITFPLPLSPLRNTRPHKNDRIAFNIASTAGRKWLLTSNLSAHLYREMYKKKVNAFLADEVSQVLVMHVCI